MFHVRLRQCGSTLRKSTRAARLVSVLHKTRQRALFFFRFLFLKKLNLERWSLRTHLLKTWQLKLKFQAFFIFLEHIEQFCCIGGAGYVLVKMAMVGPNENAFPKIWLFPLSRRSWCAIPKIGNVNFPLENSGTTNINPHISRSALRISLRTCENSKDYMRVHLPKFGHCPELWLLDFLTQNLLFAHFPLEKKVA